MSKQKNKKKELIVEKKVIQRWGELSGQKQQVENYLQNFQEEEDPMEDEMPEDEMGGEPSMDLPPEEGPSDEMGMEDELGGDMGGPAEVSLTDEQVEALIQVLQAVTNAQGSSDEMGEPEIGEPGMEDDVALQEKCGKKKMYEEGLNEESLDEESLEESMDEELEEELSTELAEQIIKKMKRDKKKRKMLESLNIDELVKNVTKRLAKKK